MFQLYMYKLIILYVCVCENTTVFFRPTNIIKYYLAHVNYMLNDIGLSFLGVFAQVFT